MLADTDVMSEMVRQRPDPGVERLLDGAPSLHLSAVSVHELRFGVALMADTPRKAALATAIEAVTSRYAANILPIDAEIARAAGDMRASEQKEGRTLALADALIAATAHVHGLTLATRNIKDFEQLGVPLLNPWIADA